MILGKDENEVINRMSLFFHSSRRTTMKDSAIQTEYDEFYKTRMVHCCHQLPQMDYLDYSDPPLCMSSSATATKPCSTAIASAVFPSVMVLAFTLTPLEQSARTKETSPLREARCSGAHESVAKAN